MWNVNSRLMTWNTSGSCFLVSRTSKPHAAYSPGANICLMFLLFFVFSYWSHIILTITNVNNKNCTNVTIITAAANLSWAGLAPFQLRGFWIKMNVFLPWPLIVLASCPTRFFRYEKYSIAMCYLVQILSTSISLYLSLMWCCRFLSSRLS